MSRNSWPSAACVLITPLCGGGFSICAGDPQAISGAAQVQVRHVVRAIAALGRAYLDLEQPQDAVRVLRLASPTPGAINRPSGPPLAFWNCSISRSKNSI